MVRNRKTQRLPGPGAGPGGAMAPAFFLRPGPGGAKAPAKLLGPGPGGAMAPAYFFGPGPGGAMAPAGFVGPGPGPRQSHGPGYNEIMGIIFFYKLRS